MTNLVGEVRYLRTRPRDNRGQSPAKVLGRAVRMTRTAIATAEDAQLTVAGLAVAVPGPVETDRGLLRLAPNLGWVDVPVADILADRFATRDLAVVVDNEANLAALGELWFGGHEDLDDFIHVSGEIGVGGGIVIGGELFRGVRGFAGEIGHVVVQPDGPRCRCGARGCLEQIAGQEAILRAAGLTGAVGTSLGQPGGSVAELLAMARDGEPDTLRAIESAGRALGIGLSATVNIVDPSTVVLGGLYAALEPWLSKPLLEELRERAIALRWSPVRAARLPPRPRRGRAGRRRGGRQAGPVRAGGGVPWADIRRSHPSSTRLKWTPGARVPAGRFAVEPHPQPRCRSVARSTRRPGRPAGRRATSSATHGSAKSLKCSRTL